jgi:2-dehydropantoate 2-reductase
MRITVIGAGAMGSVYGGQLSRAGYDVTLIDLRREHIAAIAAEGLRLSGVNGDHVIRLPAHTDAARLPPFDLAIIFVDANATVAAAASAAGLLKPAGAALTLQNGIGNLETLTATLGAGRVLGGITMNSANMPGPGQAQHSHAGPTWLGELDGKRSRRLTAIVEALTRAGFEIIVTDDVQAQVWNKFVLNCAINPLCAITGLLPGEIATTPEVDRLQTRLVEELLAVVRAKGLRLPDPDPLGTIKAHCRARYNRPSMLQHIEQGRRTEIDALNGALVREAAALGMAVPYNDAIARAIKGLEKQRMQAVGKAHAAAGSA